MPSFQFSPWLEEELIMGAALETYKRTESPLCVTTITKLCGPPRSVLRHCARGLDETRVVCTP